MPPQTPIEQLKNIGPTTAAWLREVGIDTRAELERLGPVFVYLLVRHRHPGAMVNRLLLYALHGALTGEPYFGLSRQTRAALSAELEGATLDVSFLPGPPVARPDA